MRAYKLLPAIIAGIALIISVSALILFTGGKTAFSTYDKHYEEARSRFYKNFSVSIPETMEFCGEAVPLSEFYVRESLDRELLVNTYWHSNTILMIKRSGRYFPMIDSILKAQDIPADFRYLALIESGLENVVSPAGAAGFWQFMKATAISYGLEVNSEIDERYHPEKASLAACKYLKDAYKKFNSWTFAAASYNMGMEALQKAINAQNAKTYYDLNLNRETLRYVYRIIALKIIYEAPVQYGFYLRECDLYQPVACQENIVDSTVSSWAEYAGSYKISYRMLKELNPWIINTSLTNKERKKYIIKIPLPSNTVNNSNQAGFNKCSRLFNDTLSVEHIR